jgi:hypothetical protein
LIFHSCFVAGVIDEGAFVNDWELRIARKIARIIWALLLLKECRQVADIGERKV